ncbi:MAG: 16S rRNA (cytosine(967)-C(5))-methyltransferase RsmB [Azonexus sp.]|jgi:16S rRNA (cytosine967-C5)-methyltransferase|uniref:16S rRNA (cytosine(967)-C(5))-methyltransferase RsmB n=1 Tax=Azonexus sp. TaxID=1872668 RepID=UPI002835B72C|nr:16S rRNA (cytosine(967)-C(5))-methyltransferase RsmB [Azonexus sp.]MDR0776255.1 16S rRNA (cytosine(967)-C(5))-methyltransferase RsmB [Azonexus sp.]
MSRLPSDSLAFALLQAARIHLAVLAGQSLAEGQLGRIEAVARPAVQDLVYGSLRRYGRGDFLLGRLLSHPLVAEEIRCLLLVALYRLETRPEAAHTVVDQAVRAAGELAGGRFGGLVNGVLRNYLRRETELLTALSTDPLASSQHPAWWLAELQRAYPGDWSAIVAAGNTPPPMALRVNPRRGSRAEYLERLAAEDIAARPLGEAGLALDRPLPVERLPGFAAGLVSVQDPGAQRAAELFDPAPGSRVLDACAAPGGKTAHLLERADIDLLALDLKPARCRRVTANLERLGLNAAVLAADCARPDRWWDGRPFDAILADVPCTASGVVRRHPDAKWLRRAEDIASFAASQARILDALWPLLRPGGKLLYATCSLFPAENGEQVARFLARQPLARRCHEEQLLPTAEHDGFYYCLLNKPA